MASSQQQERLHGQYPTSSQAALVVCAWEMECHSRANPASIGLELGYSAFGAKQKRHCVELDARSPQVKFVTYYRVSTPRQAKRKSNPEAQGLGLEAQQIAVRAHLEQTKGEEIATFTEIETGKNNRRPELQKALLKCRQTRATLLVAKFDRLSRNAAFLLTLRDSSMKFVAADMPTANDLTIGVLAVVAEHEREMISKRTKEALAAAKMLGVKLGNPRIKPGDDRAASIARKARVESYAHRAEELRPVYEAAGTDDAKKLCDHFWLEGVPTPQGKAQWNRPAMKRLLAYWKKVPGNS